MAKALPKLSTLRVLIRKTNRFSSIGTRDRATPISITTAKPSAAQKALSRDLATYIPRNQMLVDGCQIRGHMPLKIKASDLVREFHAKTETSGPRDRTLDTSWMKPQVRNR
jgi:hypothetical protein